MRFCLPSTLIGACCLLLTFSSNAQVPQPDKSEFDAYWYSGSAELCRYETQQLRYGEIRSGEAVLVFVTEDFNTEQQVKQENGPSPQSTSVLKLNTMHRFVTGIYDYSLMTSVFTPIDTRKYPHSLKVTNSVQDWCGQTFTQFNANDDNFFHVRSFSYFQEQSDRDIDLPESWLEDEIWNRIRISPQSLPLGNCTVVPSASYFRLSHAPMKAYKAIATLTLEVTSNPGEEYFIYSLTYPNLMRVLEIRFSGSFPYRITGWKSFNTDGELLSSGELITYIQAPYWELNGTKHFDYRDSLQMNH